MTAPRQILAGTTWLVTRRCSERRFFLRPSVRTSAIFLYVLAVAARLHGIQVHAFCVMSNHFHLLVTDPGARLPAFMQYLDSLVARAMNAAIGHWEGFWSSEASYSAVEPGDVHDVVRKAAYVLANPTAAGLVRSGRRWPGLWSAPEQLACATLVAPRPEVLFSSNGVMPASAELRLSVPPGFASAAEFRARVTAAWQELEDEARRKMVAAGRAFIGRAGVLAQKTWASPTSTEPRRTLNPRIAAQAPSTRLDAIARLRAFLDAYREALAKLLDGVRDVVFPAGTYLLRVRFGVRCERPG